MNTCTTDKSAGCHEAGRLNLTLHVTCAYRNPMDEDVLIGNPWRRLCRPTLSLCAGACPLGAKGATCWLPVRVEKT